MFVCFSGAEEQDFSGDPEAGSNGWSVLPEAEAGHHGGNTNEHKPSGCCKCKEQQSWGMECQPTSLKDSKKAIFILWITWLMTIFTGFTQRDGLFKHSVCNFPFWFEWKTGCYVLCCTVSHV